MLELLSWLILVLIFTLNRNYGKKQLNSEAETLVKWEMNALNWLKYMMKSHTQMQIWF